MKSHVLFSRLALVESGVNRGAAAVILATFVLLACPAGARAQEAPVRYTITDLGTLAGPFSSASTITGSGLIGGMSSYATEPFPLHGFVLGKRGIVDIAIRLPSMTRTGRRSYTSAA